MTDPAPHVLVADDDYGVRSTMVEILTDAGYEVAGAENGTVALEKLRLDYVSVLVLDIRMPDVEGIGVLDALDHYPPVVLLVSAFSIDDSMRERVGGKVFKYLRKPVAPLRLLEVVAAAAEQARVDGEPAVS
ncbi:MAG: response regulator [Acidimicrobiales bacterium]